MPTQSPEFFPIAVISGYLHHKEQINWTGQLNTRTAYQRRQGLNWSSYTEALGHQNCGLVIFHNIYINAFPREKSQKIKECGHRVSSHLGVHVTACLFVPYLYGPWGKRTASHSPQRTLCDFDAALQQKRLQWIACSRAAAHPVGPWGQECFHNWDWVTIICAFLLLFHCLNTWDKPQ